jgi:hypothetical protein
MHIDTYICTVKSQNSLQFGTGGVCFRNVKIHNSVTCRIGQKKRILNFSFVPVATLFQGVGSTSRKSRKFRSCAQCSWLAASTAFPQDRTRQRQLCTTSLRE